MTNIKLGLLLTLLLLGAVRYCFAESEDKLGILHPNGLLWKIEKPGLSPSYVYGTMHVADPRVTVLSPEVEQAFIRSDFFVMEVLMNAKAMDYITRASFFHDGRSLPDLMGEIEYKRLSELVKNRLLIPDDVIRRMKPWAVLMLLSMPVDSQSSDVSALDMQLYRRAVQRKVRVAGLETAQEQVAVLDSMSLQDQLWMLNRTIEEIDYMDAQMPEMLNAYVDRDLAKLVKIQQAAMYDDSEIDDRFMHQLLDVRNLRMVERMQPVLKQGNAFIAIGALHLPGDTGTLQLLKLQGYRVSVVY